MRPNAIRSDARRNDERFRVVNQQRWKCILGTLDDRLFALAEVQDLHAAICRMRNRGLFGARVPLVHGGEAQTLRFYSHPRLGRREYFGRGGDPTFTDGGVQAAFKRWKEILGNAYIQTQRQRSGSTVGRLSPALRLTGSKRFTSSFRRSWLGRGLAPYSAGSAYP